MSSPSGPIDEPAPDPLHAAVLATICRLAPETDVARLAHDRPLREQIELDSMDWLNLLDALVATTGRPLDTRAAGSGASIDSLVAALAQTPASAGTAQDAGARRAHDGREFRLRTLQADDAALDADFVQRLSTESRYQRFMTAMRELPPGKLASLTHVDQRRHLAIAATALKDGRETIVGVAHSFAEADGEAAEFAIAVADDWQGSGLAGALMRALIDSARSHGVQQLYGIVLATNRRMLQFVRRLGFEVRTDPDDRRLVRVERRLAPARR